MKLFLLFNLAILARLIAFLIFDNWDIVNDSSIPVKFAGEPAYLDYTVYIQHIGLAWSEFDRPFTFFQILTKDFLLALVWLDIQEIKPGPLFIVLMEEFNFLTEKNYLAFFYLFMGCFIGIIWSKMLAMRGLNFFVQFINLICSYL